MIDEVIRKFQLKRLTSHLCKVANVHRNGYYAWLKKNEIHAIREENDYQDYLLLRCVYDAFKGKTGYRGLYVFCKLKVQKNAKKNTQACQPSIQHLFLTR